MVENPEIDRAVYVRMIPDDARLVHTSVYAIRWCDMDAFGHVNNATYFSYFEQARIDWIVAAGASHRMVVANMSCTFIRPITYPVTLEVRVYAGRAGNSSHDTWYEIREHGCEEPLLSIGHGKVVWFDHENNRPMKIPDVILNAMT